MKQATRNIIFTAILSSFLTVVMMGGQARADGAASGAAGYALLESMFSWMQNAMMSTLQGYFSSLSDKLTDTLNDNFKHASDVEKMFGSLTSQFSAEFNEQRKSASQTANNDSKGYLSYTQGSASGHDASAQPAAVVSDMNNKYDEVQKENPKCSLNNPQTAGMNDDNCTTDQTQYTNYLLAGVTPLPTYSTNTEESPTGQKYALERQESITRQQLANKAVSNASSSDITTFLDGISTTLATPTKDSINNESDAAVTRDTLITLQAMGDIMIRQLQTETENERLLGILVSQQEEIHAQYMREMQKSMVQ